jgi:hypothetical protein
VVVDWGSPLNEVAFNVFNGHCVDISTCRMPTVLEDAISVTKRPYTISLARHCPIPFGWKAP